MQPCDATQSNAAKSSSFLLFSFWIEFHSVYVQKSLHVGTSFDFVSGVVAYCLRNWGFSRIHAHAGAWEVEVGSREQAG